MKNINLKYILAFSAFGMLLSCSDDDNATTNSRIVKSVVTADLTTFNITEGETATVELTIDKPLKDKSDFKLELVGGTGSFRDYTVEGDNNPETDEETVVDDGWGIIGHKIVLPAYASSTTFDITPFLDLLPEGTETLVFRLYPMGNSLTLVDEGSETITVNVANGTSDDVVAVVDWSENYYDSHGSLVEGTYVDVDGDEHALCDYDFDLEIYDASFIAPIRSSYTNCPEQTGVLGTDADGLYYIVPSFWTSAVTYDPAEPINFNVKVTIAKPGVWVNESVITLWNTNQGGAAEGNADAYQLAGILTKTGTSYVLEDMDGNILASGRQQSVLNRIPRKVSK